MMQGGQGIRCEAVVGHVGNQSVQGDVGSRKPLNRRELQWTHFRSVHTNKGGPTGQYGGADNFLSLRNQHLQCQSAESLGEEQEESGLFAVQRL